MKIVDIYESHCSEWGVNLQFARFNHSCNSNAEGNWFDGDELKLTSRELKSEFPTFMVLMVCCVSCECWEVTASTSSGGQPGMWTGFPQILVTF